MYKRLSDTSTGLSQLRELGVQRGREIGWDWSDFPLTIKEGCTTYIGAAPASGKTEVWLEMLINLSCQFEWNHIIYTPETGSPEEIFAELCYKFIGKPYVKSNGYEMSTYECTIAEQFVEKHFVIIDPIDEDLTIDIFYDLCDKIEVDLGKKFHTTTIDPWNELTESFIPEDLGREDKYLSRILGKVRKNARKTGRHNCVINHVRDQQAIVNGDGKRYYPMPTARDFAGGQVWFRKGLTILMIWRPPYGLSDENGRMYEDNEVHIRVAKSKPKGTSKVGTYRLFLDLKRYQYYMQNEAGEKKYANRKLHTHQYKIEEIKPVDFSAIGRQVNEGVKPAEEINEFGYTDDSCPF